MFPNRVKVVEVGPRDGLQNEPVLVDTKIKIELVNRLSACGLRAIETTSFVSPERIPPLADAEQLWYGIERRKGVQYSVLVPNLKGLGRALSAGVSHVAVFTGVSETFCRKNIACSIDESLERYSAVIEKAMNEGVEVRAYLSCVLGCPYEGDIDVGKVVSLARFFAEAGCYEISLGDTIGAGTPLQACAMVTEVAEWVPVDKLALHFHDTRGQALANIYACLELGVSVVDASVAGLGGCPYVKGSAGNVSTEDLVFMLHGMNIETGIDLDKLVDVGCFITEVLSRDNGSRVGTAGIP